MSMVAQFGVASLLWAPASPLKKKNFKANHTCEDFSEWDASERGLV